MLPVRFKKNVQLNFAEAIVQFEDYPENFKGVIPYICNRCGDLSPQVNTWALRQESSSVYD